MNYTSDISDGSILNNIKKLLGLGPEYNCFDQDIIIHINSVFASLHQMGVYNKNLDKCFEITDNSATWSDFLEDDNTINFIKTYVYLKVKLAFDPPANSVVQASYENQIKELEVRLYTRRGGY